MKIRLGKPAAAGLLFLTLFSCVRKEQYEGIGVEPWEPALAAPIINGSLELKDLVENLDKSEVNVIEQPDGLYVLVYKDTLESQTAEEIIKFPDQGFTKSFGPPSIPDISFPNRTISTKITDNFAFQFPKGEKLKYADLKAGLLTLNTTSTFNTKLTLTLTISSLVNGAGQPYKTTFDIQKGVNNKTTASLAGYRLDLDGDGTKVNSLDYTIDVAGKTGTAGEVNGAVNIDFSFADLKYKVLYGTLGIYNFPSTSGSVPIDIFQDANLGEIVFYNPTLKLDIANSFGVATSFRFDKFETVTDYGKILPIQSYGNDPKTLNTNGGENILKAPVVIGNEEVTSFELNKSNSTIVEAFAPAPSELNYSVTPSIISDGKTDQFITDKSKLKIFVTADLPLELSIKVYKLADTIRNISLPQDDFIENAIVKIQTTNSLPVDLSLQGYWLDANGKMLDTIMIPLKDLIVSGQINEKGEVISPSQQNIEIAYNKSRYNKIKNATMLKLEGSMKSSHGGNVSVKFFSFNKLQVKLAVNVKGKVEF